MIRKVLECPSFNKEDTSFIFDEIYSSFNQLCMNQNGLCVIKDVVSLTYSSQNRSRVIKGVMKDLLELVSDPFGNYAISEIIMKWDDESRKPIFLLLKSKVAELSN